MLPNGIKTSTVKIGIVPIQELSLFSLTSMMYYMLRKDMVPACPAPVNRSPWLELISFDSAPVHTILPNPSPLTSDMNWHRNKTAPQRHK